MAKVLIVEDEPDVAALMAQRLRAYYDVCFAGDGIAAITTARRERPDVIVLDLGLPAGDGLTVIERLRNLHETARTPVVVVTASPLASRKTQAFEAGVAAFVSKPFHAATLLSAVQNALAG